MAAQRIWLSASTARRGSTTVARHARTLHSIKPEAAEKTTGRLSQRHMQQALEALTHDGILMLEDVVDHDAIDKLNSVMARDAKVLMDMGDSGPFNYNKGNIQQSPPMDDPALVHPSIFFNPIATQVTSAFLGGRPTMSFISGNTAVDASQMDDAAKAGQPVHTDADFDHPTIPFACVVNVGLTRMHPENGSTGK